MSRTHRRRGVTLVEILFACALLATALIAVLTLLQRGFFASAHLGNHTRAEALSRSVLEFYGRLPLSHIEEARKEGRRGDGFAPVDPNLVDLLGAEDAYRLHVGLHRLPGRIPVRALVSRVSWDDLGRTREVTHRQVLAYGGRSVIGLASGGYDGVTELDGQAGFTARDKVPDWGRQERWEVKGYGEAPADDAYPGSAEALRQKIARAARAAVWQPDSYYTGEAGETVHFLGDAEALKEKMKARGDAATRVPWVIRTARSNKARRRNHFISRTGLEPRDLEGLPAMDIPDGLYPYTLEAVDLRDQAGYGKVVGVFMLTGTDGEEYRLVASVSPKDDEPRTLGVDAVLTRGLVEDARGAVHVLERTESRLVRIAVDTELVGRTLELRTLPAPDPDAPGTAITQRFVSEYLAQRELEPSGQRAEDELIRALTQEYFGDDAQESMPPPEIRDIPQVSTFPCGAGQPCPPRAPQKKASLDFQQHTTLRWRKRGERLPGATSPLQGVLALVAKGEGKAALAQLDAYVADNPTDTDARILRGRLRASEGDPSGGADDLAEALRARPDDVDLIRDHAGFLLRAWRLDEAPAALAAFAEAAPEDPLVDTFQTSYELARSTPEGARPPIR